MLKPGDHKVAPIGAKLRLDGPSAVSPPPCGEASRVGVEEHDRAPGGTPHPNPPPQREGGHAGQPSAFAGRPLHRAFFEGGRCAPPTSSAPPPLNYSM